MMEFVPYYALQLFMSINSLRFFSEIAFEDDVLYFILQEIPKTTYHVRFVRPQHFTLPNRWPPTSVSELISKELRWQSLEDRRKNARLSLLYKGLQGLAAIPV